MFNDVLAMLWAGLLHAMVDHSKFLDVVLFSHHSWIMLSLSDAAASFHLTHALLFLVRVVHACV